MAISLSNLAPTAAVAGMVLYCVWPNLSPASPGGNRREPATRKEAMASLLTPEVAPPPERNPFQTMENQTSATASGEAAAAEGTAAGPESSREPLPDGMTNTLGSLPPAALAEAPRPATPADADSVAPVPGLGLRLSATSVGGAGGFAVINGQVYAEGDDVKSAQVAGALPVVRRILPHLVLLEHEGQTVELRYADAVRITSDRRVRGGEPTDRPGAGATPGEVNSPEANPAAKSGRTADLAGGSVP